MLEKMRFMKKDLENQLSAVYQKGKEYKNLDITIVSWIIRII